jgi:quinoprotein glucose dehydrogenase
MDSLVFNRLSFLVALTLASSTLATPTLQIAVRGASERGGEWRGYAGSNAGLKYAPLDQINKDNVKNLRIAWRQSAMPLEVRRGRKTVAVPTNYQVTPLMVDGVLYVSAGDGSVAALNPATGGVVWTYVPPELLKAAPATNDEPAGELLAGRSANRGVAYWSEEKDARIIALTGRSLIALNAKTGALVADFGSGGVVDVTKGYRRPAASMRWTSVPVVVNDVIVIGGVPTAPDGNFMPGDIRGFDVRSGKQVWAFNVIPEFGEFGNDTWLKDSYAYSGAAGVWGLISADDELGYVYVATETPSSRGGDFWGGQRPGNNLFAESLVCLNARTGKRVWHFQAVHHGIWDYDFNAQPNLIDITVDGRRIKAIAEVSKQAFVYVLDRVTGQPVWPIEERPVPRGDTPGEWYASTQPFPTKPPPYDQQGVRIDDLIDFTPELREEAIKILSQYRYGSLFTPPSVAGGPSGTKGTVQMPGAAGGSNWTGAGADPETGILYVTSVHAPFIAEMIKAQDPEASRVNHPTGAAAASVEWTTRSGNAVTGPWLEGPRGLPIFKPPYGRLVAIDLNKGDILWTAANGNGPRDHPAIKHLNLPPLGQGGRASPLVTKTMVFLGEGGNNAVVALPPSGGGKMFRAYDKSTGRVLWEMELPGGTTGAPMTYMFGGRQYIVVATGWKGAASELVALALP